MTHIDLSIVIPAYNEKSNIKPLLERLNILLQIPFCTNLNIEILIVDDGSTDGSFEEITQEKNTLPIVAYRLPYNRGQSYAFLFGFSMAKGTFIATLDADLQNDPCDIPILFEEIEKADCIVGRRKNRQDIWWKKILSVVSNYTRRCFMNDGTLDSGSSLKLFRKECASTLPHFRGVHRFFPAYFSMAGYRVVEKEVSHSKRLHGKSKYSFFSRGLSIVFDFLATAWLFQKKLPKIK